MQQGGRPNTTDSASGRGRRRRGPGSGGRGRDGTVVATAAPPAAPLVDVAAASGASAILERAADVALASGIGPSTRLHHIAASAASAASASAVQSIVPYTAGGASDSGYGPPGSHYDQQLSSFQSDSGYGPLGVHYDQQLSTGGIIDVTRHDQVLPEEAGRLDRRCHFCKLGSALMNASRDPGPRIQGPSALPWILDPLMHSSTRNRA